MGWRRNPPIQAPKQEHQASTQRNPIIPQHLQEVLPGVSERISPQGPSIESEAEIMPRSLKGGIHHVKRQHYSGESPRQEYLSSDKARYSTRHRSGNPIGIIL